MGSFEQYLTGSTPAANAIPPELQAQLAAQLRSQSGTGQIMALTGDRAVAPVGQEIMKSTDADKQRLINHRYYQGMLEQNKAEMESRERIARGNQAVMASRGQTEKPMRKDIKEGVQESLGYAQTLEELAGTYNPEWASKIPGWSNLRLTGARLAPDIFGKEAQEFKNWIDTLDRFVETPYRHGFFGSALTPTEFERWKRITLDPNANAAQVDAWVKRNLNKMQIALKQNVAVAAYNYPKQTELLLGGMDPGVVMGQGQPEEVGEGDPLAYEVVK